MNRSQREEQFSLSSHRTTRRRLLRLAVAGAAAPLLGLPLMGSRSVRAQGGERQLGRGRQGRHGLHRNNVPRRAALPRLRQTRSRGCAPRTRVGGGRVYGTSGA